ncbi:MAG: amino acid ABC transporter permease, partial [Mesorhizobium sp.]
MEMVFVAPPAPRRIEDLKRRFFATPVQALLSLISLAVMVFLAWKLLNWAIFSAVFTTSGGPEA